MTDSRTTDICQIRSGDTIAHCRVLRQISVSGAVSVCLVRHEMMGDLRLLKMVSAGPEQQDAVNRLIREARTAGLVDHPNLVKVLDAGLDRERNIYYVSMEYANGCTLAEILAMTGQLSEFHALIIAEEVAAALSALSRHDVVHHSIDPENILLTRLGKVKLTGLGHAENTVLDSEMPPASPETVTPGYAAPEQLIDFHAADGRADIYSLGTVLFEMLTGTVPYPGKTPQEVLDRIRNNVQPDPGQYSGKITPAAARLIMRMTAKRYFDRPADAGQLLTELRDLRIIPPGTDREQAVRELITRAESGTYCPESPAVHLHSAVRSGTEKQYPVRRWIVAILVILLIPLAWLAWETFPFMQGQTMQERTAIAQSNVPPEETTERKPAETEETELPKQEEHASREETSSGRENVQPESPAARTELTPEEMYREAEKELRSGNNAGAVKLLEKASAGYPAAEMQLGMMYLEGRGLPADRNMGIRLLTHAAERGLAEAQYLLAMFYKSGPDADPKQSLNWCRLAVESGHAAAVKELALMLRDGIGCEPDPRSALSLLEQSARNGDPESMYLAGEMYQDGQGTVRDPGKAEKYYRQAAAAGFSSARKKLGQLELQKKRKQLYLNYQQKPAAELFKLAEDSFRNGRSANGLELLKMAAQKRYGPAQLKLATLHLNGNQIDDPDPQYGFKLILDAARQGIPEAQYQTAKIYLEGKIVKADPQRAFGWCRRAADKNYPPAMGLLGDFYRQGVGCAANPAMARVYYEQGMQKGHTDSIYKLAQLLDSGEAGSHVPEKAVKYYRMAADAGHPEAKAALARLVQKKPEPAARPVEEPDPVPASSGDPAEGNAETMYLAAQKIYDTHTTSPTRARQAYDWCWKASAKGHVKARGLLGIMNLKGFGCPIDLKEALRLLRDAAELGDVESLFQLGESYRLGIGTGQDSQMAIKYYRQAAAKGHPKARQRLAGPRPRLKKFSREEFIYHLSWANRGDLQAQYLVGMAFVTGNGTRPDPKKGYLWLMEAALRDHPDAQCQVGILLHDGIGCTRSYQAAFRWFSKAADQEHPEGTFRLGEMYLLGKGLDQPDHHRAAELFHRAAMLGSEDAARSLDSLKRATLTNGR